MRWTILCVASLLTGCEAERSPAPRQEPVLRPAFAWRSVESAQGAALRLEGMSGGLMLNLACVGDPPRLVASVPDFSAIGSEERLSVGVGGEPTVLAVDPAAQRGAGVRGEAALPQGWLERLARGGEVGASYGAQTLEPVAGPPPEMGAAFVRACGALP